MNYSEIIGQTRIKKYLQSTLEKGMVPHAQLFTGKAGYGVLPMAMAYATDLLSKNTKISREATALKCKKCVHPDLHFVYPVAANDTVKKNPVSKYFLNQWQEFLSKNPYGNLLEWYEHIGIGKKQGIIGVDETSEINKTLALKSFYGGFKVMIFWNADKMNTAAANKLLKLIEEPPEQTVLILITEKIELLLDTVISRCQVLNFQTIAQEAIVQHLTNDKNIPVAESEKIAMHAQGDYHQVLKALHKDYEQELLFEKWFASWVRIAFSIKNKMAMVEDLVTWSHKIAEQSKELQKAFVSYCIGLFREALLYNYTAEDLVFFKAHTDFKFEKFASFIHSKNILPIYELLNETAYSIERNVFAKNNWLNASIKLTRFLHLKEPQPENPK